jgi:hypothetical protein
MASASLPAILLILSAAALAILAPTCSAADSFLLSGHSLSAGESLEVGNYKLTMQSDCNLVLYNAGSPVWSTDTENKGSDCRLDMQDDGNLVIYADYGHVVWSSNTYKVSVYKYILVLQPNGEIVIYGPNIWATATNIDDVSASRNSTTPAAVAGDGKITMVTEK